MVESKKDISILVGGRLKEVRRIDRGCAVLELVFDNLPNYESNRGGELVLVLSDSEGYMPCYAIRNESPREA